MSLFVIFCVFVALFAILATVLLRKVKNWIPKDMDKFFQSVDGLSSRRLFKMKFLQRDLYLVNDPELIHKVLNSETCLEKPQMIYKFLNMDEGLICSKYDQWRRDRRNFSGSFNNVMVNAFAPIFCEITDHMVETIKTSACGQAEEVDMIHFTERCTISMILASSFNVFPQDHVNREEDVDKVAAAVKMSSLLLCERFRKFQLFFETFFKRTSEYRQLRELKDYLHATLFDILEAKSERIRANQEEVPAFDKNIFVNKMMSHMNEMTHAHVQDSVSTVVGAGFETTGTAAAHCILLLAMHPEIQERAFQEIMTIFPSEEIEITPETLAKLEFLECVMKESLRLAPTVHAIAREAMSDFEIEPQRVAAKGTIFCINIYGLHRRKDLWGEDADLFNPDRFLPENFRDKQQFFIPFSAGKRNCIGYRYAYMSFKIMLVKLLRHFTFTTSMKLEDVKFNRQIALKLIGKHSVKIEKRIE